MNIEELRKALASDATEKAKEQEKTIKKLKKQLADMDKNISFYEDVLRTQFNRCYAQSHGLLCIFCAHIGLCDKLRDVGKGKQNGSDNKQQND